MNRKLFVGNLSFSVDDDALKEVFARVGDVESARVITDPHSGRSRGFGFVEMNDESTALEAMEKLNGEDVDGRPLRIDKAQPRERGPRQNA